MRDLTAMERADADAVLKHFHDLDNARITTADFLETQAYVAECATDGAYIMVSLTNKKVREIANLLRRLRA